MSVDKRDFPFTYEDYKRITASTDERYELLDGELYIVPSPATIHQIVSKDLQFLLEWHVRRTGCGQVLNAPLDVVLGEGATRSVVQPDIIFISNERLDIIEEPEIAGAPDLVVEILSPTSAQRDRQNKKALYARSGVREYWVVDPSAKSIEVFPAAHGQFGEGTEYGLDDRLTSAVLEGFEPQLLEIFRTA
ncbi:MAG TPA: Uma2 family endonuclease [Gammaproteobacteria bacterium]|nr:Uma2 family endonuclease [Gammaproteobacteria bacterium]